MRQKVGIGYFAVSQRLYYLKWSCDKDDSLHKKTIDRV